MRTKRTLINIVTSLLLGMVVIGANFALQRVISTSLGVEYLGINSLFTTTIALLSVAELGFGSAVIYHLYKPLRERDWSRVSVLMAFYRRVYIVIGVLVLLLGLTLLPFLSVIVGDNRLNSNIYVIFVLFLVNSIISYFLSYKRSLLQADQKSYLIDIIHTSVFVVISIFQIIILFVTHNYYLFLMGNILLTVGSNLIINRTIRSRYKQFVTKNVDRIDPKTRQHIFNQVKGLIFHKISSFIVPSSSNIIISLLLGLKSVGLASNYFLIASSISLMTWKISGAITASVGNLLVDADERKLYMIYKRLQFAAAILAALVSVTFFAVVDLFVELWVGTEYVLGLGAAIAFSVTIYLTIIRIVPNSFKQAAGIFYEDRYVPVLEALINIIFAVMFAVMFGLEGVFWGLAVSLVFLHVHAYPKYVYVRILKMPARRYLYDLLSYLIITLILGTIVYYIKQWLDVGDLTVALILNSVIALITVVVVWALMYARSPEAIYYKNVARKKIAKLLVKDKI